MNIAGKKTKIGSFGLIISGFLMWGNLIGVSIVIPIGLSLISFGIAIYGFYDRSSKNHQKQVQKLEEIRGRIKKPSIM